MARKDLIPYVKGQSGNPKGRPKGRSIKLILRDLLELNLKDPDLISKYTANLPDYFKDRQSYNSKEIMALMMISRALNDNDVFAAEKIFDRVDGKVKDKVEHTGSMAFTDFLKGPNESNKDED